MTNALTDPWIPVERSGSTELVSLSTALSDGHRIDGLAGDLHPLARACLHRLLDSVAAYGLQGLDLDDIDEYGETGLYPAAALARLGEQLERFELTHPTKPFLQAWGYTPPEKITWIDKLGNRSFTKGFLPVGQLDPHIPGDFSSKLGTRKGAEHLNHAEILLGLTIWWFSSSWSTKKALPGLATCVVGSPTYDGQASTEFHWIGKTLGLTTAAGILESWTKPAANQTPVWLEQVSSPTLRQLTATPDSLWRVTYTPNRPFVVFDGNEEAIAWGIGAVDGKKYGTLPALGDPKKTATRSAGGLSDREKSATRNTHDDDPYRLHLDVTKRTGKGAAAVETIERKVYSNSSHSLLSTQSALAWFASGFGDKLASWGRDRVAEPSHRSPEWGVGVFMDLRDNQGGVHFQTTWVTLDSSVLAVTGPSRESVMVVVNYLETVAKSSFVAVRHACDDKKLAEVIRAQVLASLDPLVADTLHRAGAGEDVDPDVCGLIKVTAERALALALNRFSTPDRVGDIAAARGRFSQKLGAALPRRSPLAGTGDSTTIEIPGDAA